ncbi:TetR/AcrR family transcriptional regulator [Actinoplanes regularis]|uniref:Transcriptional regulator, TetR family n=1 Tax=Actinoplanes regularis TaxID=52697 RepID=A0A239FP77_9ACTN|nr:TetR/AcrR family transcriptional regulator [Actinoplanes regularis]GIE89701.1 TetR family transcriptional regulator [Actinoplanes regularis]SNS58595.1 transcriptional regulator, TetR family [Actinoplanes regularis]
MPKSDTRARIIASARTLLRRHGYHATGLAQIIKHSGAPRGSVYFLFPGGKEQMAVAAISEWTVEFDQLIRELSTEHGTARAWVEAMADHFANDLRASDYTEGLPITTITLDSVPTSAGLTVACRNAYDVWLTALIDGLVTYGEDAGRADRLAKLMMASLEGAAVLCRAYQSTAPLEQIVPFVLDQLPAGTAV